MNYLFLAFISAIFGVFCFWVGYTRPRRDITGATAENTELKLEIESIKVSNAQLESALENVELLHRSKNLFYASTSHDLRQPLHALSMFSTVLQKRNLDGTSKEIIADISEAVLDVTREIEVLLDIARIDVGNLKLHLVEIDLDVETRRIVNQFQREARLKGLELRVISESGICVYGDRTLFDRVLRNLIDNAVKFTDQGYVSISIEHSPQGVLKLTVVDTGIGISLDDQESIYREFYQGKNLSGSQLTGVGLGLNTVAKMVSRLDGEISVDSNGRSGTRVTLEVPDVKRVNEAVKKPEEHRQGKPAKSVPGRVLVLINDVLVGKSTVMMLESAGYSVVSAYSLSEAHSLLRAETFDAACLELESGEQQASKLVDALKEKSRNMPVVIITTDRVYIEQYGEDGAIVLMKPVDSNVLLKKLRKES